MEGQPQEWSPVSGDTFRFRLVLQFFRFLSFAYSPSLLHPVQISHIYIDRHIQTNMKTYPLTEVPWGRQNEPRSLFHLAHLATVFEGVFTTPGQTPFIHSSVAAAQAEGRGWGGAGRPN